MKLSLIFVLAVALFSLVSASPLLITKHVVKKALFKGGLHLLHHHHLAKSAGKVVHETHYVAVPPPVHVLPHVQPLVVSSGHHHKHH